MVYYQGGGVIDRSSVGEDDVLHVSVALGCNIEMTVGSALGVSL